MLTLELADKLGLAWAQTTVTAQHYLHRPVDSRCSVLAYLVMRAGERVGCLIFGRPEATRCYAGGLTYGSQADVAAGRARWDRWELINLARVWLDPRIQAGGEWHEPNAATWAIGQALRRVVVDYLVHYPPCFLDEPWRLRQCISYCDTSKHKGTIYRAAGFERVRVNERGVETWARPLRGLQGHERQRIERLAAQSGRSRRYRAGRAHQVTQEAFL